MKAVSPALEAFLLGGGPMVYADLYTFAMAGGASVLLLTGAPVPVPARGGVFQNASISDSGAKATRGLSVDSITLTLGRNDLIRVQGVPIIPFARGRGFEGALVRVDRAYARDWGTPWIGGTLNRFTGRYSELKDAGDSAASMLVVAGPDALSQPIPFDVYQTSCLNQLYDKNCGVSRTNLGYPGAITAQATAEGPQRAFYTNVTPARVLAADPNRFLYGTLILTSGANVGQRRTVKVWGADGYFQLVSPLPEPVAAGDTFAVYPGCDRTYDTCRVRFGNTLRFRGQPAIPVAETAI